MSDTTRPGGYYIGSGGIPHDAHGNIINEVAEVKSSVLPDNFPARLALIAAGLSDADKVRVASDEELLAVDGIGKATLDKIRNYGA